MTAVSLSTLGSAIARHGWASTAAFMGCWLAAFFLGVSVLAPSGFSLLWPAAGVLTSSFLFLPPAGRVAVGLMAAGVCVLLGCLALPTGMQLIVLGAVGLLEASLVAGLIRRFCGRNLDFSDPRRMCLLTLAVLIGCGVSTFAVQLAVPVLHLSPRGPGTWFPSHVSGQLIAVLPAGVLANRRRFRASRGSPWELSALLTLIGGLVTAALTVIHGPAMALTVPLMMLVAFRHGPIGSVLGSFVIGMASILTVCISMRLGLEAGDMHEGVPFVQFITCLAFATNLPIARAVASAGRLRTVLAKRTEIARRARRRADAAAAAKGEFLANMSHEIRTPLNGVIGVADLLSRSGLTPEQQEMTGMILSAGRGLTGLLGDLLDLARADSGALKLVEEPFDVRETLGAASFLFEAIAQDKGVGFEVAFDLKETGALLGDTLRIKQVVSNLISNAVKFTSHGAVNVEVSTAPAAPGAAALRVRVRDTGPGFDDEVKARLFNRFEQADGSVTRRFGGSGLGLSIARRLVQMMGGELGCESVPGKGSTFTLAVQLPVAETLAPAASTGPCAPASERALSVLLAEDHPVNRYVVQAMLAGAAEITVAVNGREALEALERSAFDIVLMDTHMPELDGLSAIRSLRALERREGRARTPVISLTADAMAAQVSAALAAGADGHLAKPFTAEELFAAMEACLSAPAVFEAGREVA